MKSFLTGFFSAIILAVIILYLLPGEQQLEDEAFEQTIELQIPEPLETETLEKSEPASDTQEIAEEISETPDDTVPDQFPDETVAEEIVDTTEKEATDTAAADDESDSSPLMMVHQVNSGDTLLSIFSRLNIDQQQYHRLVAAKSKTKGLSSLRPGQMLFFHFDENRNLTKLTHESNAIESDNYLFGDDGIELDTVKKAVEIRTETAHGNIRNSLFVDGEKAGMSGKLILNMAKLFNWDIDFGSELKQGDYFGVVYEGKYVDGERIGTGDILAAEFINNNKQYRVVRYEDEYGNTDYLDDNGRSRRKKFIRTPLNFTRISSKFTTNRYHPVLKRWRSHKGVDYAAPTGTPVWATGDGVVHIIGRQRGYGKVIYIKHGKYMTVYGHLSAFKRGLKKGDRVKQNQVIGYVGQTGLATGPHLHYEFRINGSHVNPLSAKLPVQDPLNKARKKRFLATAQPLLKTLDLLKGRDVAMND